MDIIIEYLIQKGGVFGALFAGALAWIVYRERHLLGKSNTKEEEDTEEVEKKNPDIEKIIATLEDIKKDQNRAFKKLDGITPSIEQIYSINKNELSKIEKVFNLSSSMEPRVVDIEKKTAELWQWHSVKDSDGIPVWYIKRSMEETIGKLKDSIETLDKNYHVVTKSIMLDLDDRLQKVNDDRISELKKLLETYNKTVTDLVVALEKIKFLLKSKEDGE